jgi:hypothetical protein
MPRGGARANSGGSRPGAGRPRRKLHLDTETARLLALLTKQQRQVAPDTTEETIVANLIHAAYAELDDAYQVAALDQATP